MGKRCRVARNGFSTVRGTGWKPAAWNGPDVLETVVAEADARGVL
jgi:hypothetical protein